MNAELEAKMDVHGSVLLASVLTALHSNVSSCRNLPKYQEELREIIRHCEKGLALQEQKEPAVRITREKKQNAA